LICKNIEFEDLFIDDFRQEIRLVTHFEHKDHFYYTYFRYSKENPNWHFISVEHADAETCKHCISHMDEDSWEDYQCWYLEQYRNQIFDEIMSIETIQDKIRNFRLEAITCGYNY
jgi:hypothetical protein